MTAKSTKSKTNRKKTGTTSKKSTSNKKTTKKNTKKTTRSTRTARIFRRCRIRSFVGDIRGRGLYHSIRFVWSGIFSGV